MPFPDVERFAAIDGRSLRRPSSGVPAMVPGLLPFALADLGEICARRIDSYVVFEG